MISREEAINELKIMRNLYSHIRRHDREWEATELAIEALSQPERPKGRWKQGYDYQENYSNWCCSECGCEPYYESNIEEEYKFCPNCGAEMVRGEE